RIVGALLLCTGMATATTVACSSPNTLTGIYQTAAALSGCQSGALGLTHDPTPTAWDDFYVAWNITLSGGVYTYNYTFSDPGGTQKGIFEVILGVSDSCTTVTSSSSEGNPAKCIWNLQTTL